MKARTFSAAVVDLSACPMTICTSSTFISLPPLFVALFMNTFVQQPLYRGKRDGGEIDRRGVPKIRPLSPCSTSVTLAHMARTRIPPPVKYERPTVHLGIRIPPSLDKALDAYAAAHGLPSRSAAAVHAMRWAFE